MKHAALVLTAALLLAACGDGPGTSISITGENGSAGIINGVARIDLPNFKGNVSLPKFQVSADNLDIDGVKLFPESTVSGVNVFAHDGDREDRVRIAFESPATVAAVREHFRSEFAKAGFTATVEGAGLVGKTADGKPFRLTLGEAGSNRAKGELAVGG